MIRLRVLPVAAALAVVALLSGCHGSTGPSGSPTASASSSSGASASSSAKPTDTPSPTATAAAAPACTRDGLKITYQGTDNSAGHFHGVLTFTNTGAAACSMNGYPIAYLGQEEAEGTQGAASTNDSSSAPSLVNVAPGAAAHASITITDAGNVCAPVDTSYLVVAPPLTVPFDEGANAEHVYNVDVQACDDPSISLIQVGSITS